MYNSVDEKETIEWLRRSFKMDEKENDDINIKVMRLEEDLFSMDVTEKAKTL